MPPQMTGPPSNASSPMPMSRHTASPQPPLLAARMPQYSAPPMASQIPPTSIPQSVSWHQPSGGYPPDMSTGRATWNMNAGGFMDSGAQYTMREQRIPSISQSLGGFMYVPPGAEYSAQRSTQA